jgi:hypothetical protein
MKNELLEAAYLAGFNASGEGYNGEFPFDDRDQKPQHDPAWCKDRDNAITAIKQALAQPAPVQEPVAWLYKDDWGRAKIAFSKETANDWGTEVQPLYTTQPAAPAQEPAIKQGWDVDTLLDKPAAPVQEPVAWMHWLNGPCRVWMNKDEAMMELDRLNREYPVDNNARKVRPLVFGDTTPPAAQRQWVGLTPTERKQIEKRYVFVEDAIRLTEAKLKEKNT